MKNSRTGERLSLDHIRAGVRRLLRRREPDGGAAGSLDAAECEEDQERENSQAMVEELMETTPSSSFDEDEWRDGFVYERPQAPSSPPLSFGDGTAKDAGGAVGDAAEGLFVKEEVPQIQKTAGGPRPSLLSARIEQLSREKSFGEAPSSSSSSPSPSGPAPVSSGDAAPDPPAAPASGLGEALMAAGGAPTAAVAATGGAETTCTVHDVIVALLTHCAPSSADAPPVDSAENELEATAFDLRIMDEDGMPDMDFPELDRTVPVTDFGVEEFVLCRVGAWKEPLFEVRVQLDEGPAAPATQPIDAQFRPPGGNFRTLNLNASHGTKTTPPGVMQIRNLDSGEVLQATDLPKTMMFPASPRQDVE